MHKFIFQIFLIVCNKNMFKININYSILVENFPKNHVKIFFNIFCPKAKGISIVNLIQKVLFTIKIDLGK